MFATSREKFKRNRPPRGACAGIPSLDCDEEHCEKPWQRVSSLYVLLVLLFYLLLAYLTQLTEDSMPVVVKDADIPFQNTETFSEESARRYLDIILGNAPRVAGTKYHLEKAIDLKTLLDGIASKAKQTVRTDWQFVSGCFWLEFKPPYVSWYQNVSNIVAVLEGESGFAHNGTLGTSLLLNCHYDSVPFALGASDNGIFCAAMVEALVRLSRRKTKLKHNIVFLFNGAEENALQGSHGFISHPWFKGVTNVVNLDSAGMNGRPNLFQMTDGRMMDVYKHTNKPTGQSIGEVLFSTGIIPSDTDFRIWRDFGHIQGIDLAFIKWGHLYHTRNDVTKYIEPGVIQCAGDMLLRLITGLADFKDLKNKHPQSHAVFYDYMSVLFFTYSEAVSTVVDAFVCLLGGMSVLYYLWIVGFRWSIFRELLWAVVSRILCAVVGIAVVAVFVLLMVATTVQLRYLSQPWIVAAIYWIPYVIVASSTSLVFDAWRSKKSGLNRSLRVAQAATATRVLLVLPLLVLLMLPATASLRYALSFSLGLMTLTSAILLTMLLSCRLTGWQHLLLEIMLSLPLFMYKLSLSLRLTSVLIPIMGRNPVGEPDYAIAVVSLMFSVYSFAPLSGMELLFSRKRWWGVTGGVFAVCVVIMFIPFNPYASDVAVQRHNWFHTEIVSYNQNGSIAERLTGVLITKWDKNNIQSARTALKDSGLEEVSLAKYCEKYPYCNMPLFRARMGKTLKEALFLSFAPPAKFEHSLRLTNKTCLAEECTLHFAMTGPPHGTLVLFPQGAARLRGWSLPPEPRPSDHFGSEPLYIITCATPTYSDRPRPFVFSLTFVVPPSLQAEPIASISHSAFKIQHPEDLTPAFRTLIGSMPEYFNIAPAISFKSNYVF